MSARRSSGGAGLARFAPPHVPRRWCVPPGLARDPAAPEAFEGQRVLAELPGPAGYLLFVALREVLVWSAAGLGPALGRGPLFAPGAYEARREAVGREDDPGLRVALEALSEVLRVDAGTAPAGVKDGCLRLSRWAAAAKAPSTALAFARAAAGIEPQDPGTALRVGALARRFGRPRAAEEWTRRALRLAQRAGNWAVYAAAWTELARLFHAQRDPVRARNAAISALRASRRYRVREVRGEAYHILAEVELEAGPLEAAARHAGHAERWLGSPARLAPLRVELLLRQGDVAAALDALPATVSDAVPPAERTRVLGALLRAAAGTRDRGLLQKAWTEALGVAESLGETPEGARAYLELASAAESWLPAERVANAARWAAVIARRLRLRGEDDGGVERDADTLLLPGGRDTGGRA